MAEFMELTPPNEALAKLLENLPAMVESETIDSTRGRGRVLAEDVLAPHPMPPFARSTVDGYAVRAEDTFGASETLPAYLDIAGEVLMGAEPGFAVEQGKCALIHTGGMLPAGADAVVMVERTMLVNESQVEIHKAAAVAENVIHLGEDVAAGEVVIRRGKRLRAAEIGGLMAIGKTTVEVARKPIVGLLSTGNEVVPPDVTPGMGQVRDINTYTLMEIVSSAGGEARSYGIISDEMEELTVKAKQALDECDMVLITAGSSVSHRDITAQVIERLGAPGVLVHGINLRPGKPTIFGVCKGKAVIGLPGNPVSAFVVASMYISPIIGALQGESHTGYKATFPAKLTINLPSVAGREDWVAVKLQEKGGELSAEPVFGKSNLIFTLVRANGLIRIPPEANGIQSGEIVMVHQL